MAKYKKIRSMLTRRSVVVSCSIVLAGLLLFLVLELTNTIDLFHNTKKVSDTGTTASSESKGETPLTQNQAPTTATGQASQSAGNNKSSGTSSTSAPLKDPFGNFVSNHRPNLSGYPAPNEIQSICNTTPGATCQINFTKDGVTKSLPSQTTDSEGATYWAWKLQDIGLTQDTWQIQAKATLNGQVKAANDALDLVVSP